MQLSQNQLFQIGYGAAWVKHLRSFLALLGFLAVALPREARPADKRAPFHGRLSSTLARNGGQTTQLLFTRKDNRLRIENTDNSRPEPINVVELDSGRVTIVFPHNS